MGLFFMSVGMGIDLTELLSQPLLLPLSVIGLVLTKGLIIAMLFRYSACRRAARSKAVFARRRR